MVDNGSKSNAGTPGQARFGVVLADGVLADVPVIRRRLEAVEAPFVIAADGGARHAAPLGIAADVVVGDLDSIDSDVLHRLRERGGVDVLAAPVEKDETDLELALLHAARLGLPRIIVLAALGGRLDMMLSNLLLLTHDALEGRSVELWDGWQSAWLIRPPGGLLVPPAIPQSPWAPAAGDRISLIPLDGDALGVTTHRLEYPLHGESLRSGPARGVSNVISAEGATLELSTGMILVVHAPSDERRLSLDMLHAPIRIDQ